MFDWLFGIAKVVAEAQTAGADDVAQVSPAAGLLSSFLPMILIFVVFYFMLIRPQRKKDKKVKEMLDNLKVGDRICTIGGIYGTVAGLRENEVHLKVGTANTPMVIARWAVRNVETETVQNEGDLIV
jgi:preprotein translocase subunit YajC